MGSPSFQGTLNKITNGRVANPTRPTAERIAKHFNIPVEAVYDPHVAEATARELGLDEPAPPRAAPVPPPQTGERPPTYAVTGSVGDALTTLAAAIAAMPRLDRAQLQPLLSLLTAEPESRGEICERIVSLIAPGDAYRYQHTWEDMARQVATRTGAARMSGAQFVALVDESQGAHVALQGVPTQKRAV